MTRLLLIGLFALAACSSKKKEHNEKNQPTKAGQMPEWDYDKVRQNRATEAEQNAADKASEGDEDAPCEAVTKKKMLQDGITGCKPMSASAGLGENMFCCPK